MAKKRSKNKMAMMERSVCREKNDMIRERKRWRKRREGKKMFSTTKMT